MPPWVFALAEIVLMLLLNGKIILNFHLHFLNVMYEGQQVQKPVLPHLALSWWAKGCEVLQGCPEA